MNAQDYIIKRLAELRANIPDASCYPTIHATTHGRIVELEALQAHLSQSTRPEPSGGSVGGQYSVEQGNARSYLKNAEGFTVAQTHTWGESGLQDLRKLASDLNQLEALRASHGELIRASSRVLDDHREGLSFDIAWEDLRKALAKAQSTPTAAPQGQQ